MHLIVIGYGRARCFFFLRKRFVVKIYLANTTIRPFTYHDTDVYSQWRKFHTRACICLSVLTSASKRFRTILDVNYFLIMPADRRNPVNPTILCTQKGIKNITTKLRWNRVRMKGFASLKYHIRVGREPL